MSTSLSMAHLEPEALSKMADFRGEAMLSILESGLLAHAKTSLTPAETQTKEKLRSFFSSLAYEELEKVGSRARLLRVLEKGRDRWPGGELCFVNVVPHPVAGSMLLSAVTHHHQLHLLSFPSIHLPSVSCRSAPLWRGLG